MKKTYMEIEIEIVLLLEEVVRTSTSDNVTDMPDFPEFLG